MIGLAVAGGRARADEPGRRPAVKVSLADCLEPESDAIERAVRVEVGEPAPDDASAVGVRVECAADGLEAGVVVEVRQPGNPRRYRYALDWRTQPVDARPRLIGLAVAEAVDASRIELTAVPEPLPAVARATIAAPGSSRAASDWSFALVVDQRTFRSDTGVDLVGVGLTPSRRLSTRVRLAADVLVEGATALVGSGAVVVRSVSSAPRLVVRAGGDLHGELAIGARLGVVRMRGEALPGSQLVGERLVRAWLGPAAMAAVGIDLSRGFELSARLELGVVAAGATARDLGEPVLTLDGVWTSFGLAAAIAL